MSDADRAYELAKEKIAEAERGNEDGIAFEDEVFRTLDRVPPEIGKLGWLQGLNLERTQISDISPISSLRLLWSLNLNSTKVSDLKPLQGLKRLRTLGLRNTPVRDLAPLAESKSLLHLDLSNTQVIDIKPLAGLAELEHLWLENSSCNDLRPIAMLTKLAPTRWSGLHFAGISATKRDAALNALAKIGDNQKRTGETLAYLRSLPPWPEPYTPAATPDGSPPQPIGGKAAPVGPQATKSQITHLLRNATATRLTAQEFASQIRTALQGVPATDGNKLAEPLQTMLEFADVLDRLAPQSEPATDPLDRAKLELRIAQLETLVARLTQQLRDETTARETAEALAGKGIFARSFKEEAGKRVAQVVVLVPSVLVCTGLYQAAMHYLGVGNPVLDGMSRLLLKAGD